MVKSKFADFIVRYRDVAYFVLSWTSGLLVGSLAALFTDPISLSGMREAVTRGVSIPGSFVASLIPFLAVAYTVFVSRPKWICLIAFIKAFSFSYIGLLIHIVFGSAGWLVRCFFQFSGLCAAPVFCWFCARHISGAHETVRRDLRFVSVLMAAIAAVDFFVIAPYLIYLTVI